MELSLLSEDEIKKIAVIRIESQKDLESPLFGSLNTRCIYCGLHETCPGHCGYVELDQYIVNPLFEKTLTYIMNHHCHQCGAKRSRRCPECNHVSPSELKYNETTLDMRNKSTIVRVDEIMRILNRVNPYTARIMMKYVIVPPSRIRSYTPEYPDLSQLSRLYSRFVDQPSYKSLKDIIGSQRKSLLYNFISGKNGIFRNTALGKRVNRSGRCVIVPDPFLPVDTVALPEKIWNVMKSHPDDARRSKHVCINRQPSLSKYSIMSFRAIQQSRGDVMYIHPCITPAFNADFDGDEMNVYLLDHPSSRAELVDLVSVNNNIVSYQSGLPSVYPVQDVITGCYMMTSRDIAMTSWDRMEIAMITSHDVRTFGEWFEAMLPGYQCGQVLTRHALLRLLTRVDLTVQAQLHQVVCGWLFRHGLTATMPDVVAMIESGAKGNQRNYDSIVSQVGDQYVNGQWIGHCDSSYTDGLTPDEYFMHQRAAREGVVNIGVNTAGTGYLSRRACKKMSEAVLSYENTVVDRHQIICFDF